MRIEAAAYHGRPVWFDLLLPWRTETRRREAREPTAKTPVSAAGMVILALAMPIGGVLLARRNLRLGRGDLRGANRVALFVFLVFAVARLFRADHLAGPEEVWILIKVFAYPAFWGVLVLVLYVALEPYARRRWPHVLIAWKRLLDGRVRDPLVGRGLLLGAAIGLVMAAAARGSWLLPLSWGVAPGPPDLFVDGPTLTELRQATFVRPFVNAFSAVFYGLVFLFILVLLRVVTRTQWLAAPLWCALLGNPFKSGDPALIWLEAGFRAVVLYVVLTRAGLLTFVTTLFFMFAVLEIPLTLDFRTWYAAHGLPFVLIAAAVIGYGFSTSLAGKPALGRALLDD